MCFISSKAGVFCRAKDLDVEVTESWGESKKNFEGEVDESSSLPASPDP